MPELRDSSWLRRTLCDEIELVRAGKSDHNRAKAVAALAATVLKSVEVEMVFRQQQSEMDGTEHAELGALPLCAEVRALPEPRPTEEQQIYVDETQETETLSDEPQAAEREPVRSPIVPPGARFVSGRNSRKRASQIIHERLNPDPGAAYCAPRGRPRGEGRGEPRRG